MSKIRLNNVDLAWLRMDSPINPMMITVVMQCKGQLDYDQLITKIEVILARYRRFQQRIIRPGQIFSRPYWEDVPNHRVEDHIEHQDIPLPADEATLGEFVNWKMNTPLDFAHPLWKITLVDNHPDGTLLIVRVHHCIADGISLMQVLLQMTQTSLDEPAVGATALQANGRGLVPPTMYEANPGAPASRSSAGYLRRKPTFTDIVAATARIIFRSADPPTILKGTLGKIKKVVWTEPLSVAEIKKIAKSKQATINDVLMAVTAGAIRHYMDLHNDHRKRNIRAFIMVNLRGRSVDEELGNKFGLVFLTLPIDREQPMERLEAIKQGMDILKASAEYAASYIILNILGQLPEWIEHLATKILDAKGTVVATNVPGPRHPIYLAGAPIHSIMAWVPQTGRIGVGVSFISYNDQLFIGFNVDAGLIPDAEIFPKLFVEEYKCLQADLSIARLD